MDQADAELMLDMSLDDIIKMRKEKAKSNSGGKASKKAPSKPAAPIEPYATTGIVCLNCLQPGHKRANCPQDKVCTVCGKSDHAKAECPKLKETCRKCGQVGHLQSRCISQGTQVRSTSEAAPAHCFGCGSASHKKAACPHANKTCDVCKQIGHLKAMCPKSQMPAGARASMIAAVGRPILPSADNKAPILTAVPKACFVCGSVAHERKNCPHKAQVCEACGKQGHFSALCPMVRQ